jgi:DNA-binding NtrC family response regulator
MAHLLVIDDDASVRQTMRRILLDAGHSVIEADNGTTGLAQLTQSPIDIVLTDIFMPGTEGVETIQQIRRLRPTMKIIAMSGAYSSDAYLSAAAKLGAQAVLKKPFRTAELRDTVNQVLALPVAHRAN